MVTKIFHEGSSGKTKSLQNVKELAREGIVVITCTFNAILGIYQQLKEAEEILIPKSGKDPKNRPIDLLFIISKLLPPKHRPNTPI